LKSSETITRLVDFIEARLKDMGYELVDHRMSWADGRETLELYCGRIDDSGICVGDCGEIARRMKPAIDAEGFFEQDFSLIVSSPGLDRVVKKPEDFVRFNGREIKVFLVKSSGGKKLVGKLLGFEDGIIKLGLETGEEEIIEPDQYTLIRLQPEIEGFGKNKEKPVKKKGKNV
jgi:ribosome maturation factor RimP